MTTSGLTPLAVRTTRRAGRQGLTLLQIQLLLADLFEVDVSLSAISAALRGVTFREIKRPKPLPRRQRLHAPVFDPRTMPIGREGHDTSYRAQARRRPR